MNVVNENQHWISQILLKRFKIEGMPLQCYQLDTDEWVEKSVERVCSGPGYNQLTVSGETDNSLEAAFSKIESGLRNSLRALEAAANSQITELPPAVYENICWYCSFLKGVAPYSKPGSVASFLIQLNMELETGMRGLIYELKVPEETISELQRQHSMGRRVIVESNNLLQLLYRFQFARNYGLNFSLFLSTNWTISSSAIELPIGVDPFFKPAGA